ncbi:MAG TPA: hypothetical protein VN445_05705 [Rectinemataceae bacterium]|nr:hypothetical protein [Rectinemataceae bacterium]
MKKAIVPAMVIGAFFAGCSPFAINTKGYTYIEENLRDAWKDVASHKYINEDVEYWASPMEFEARGGGDCEDFAFALVYRLGRSSSSVCVLNPKGGFHEIVKFKDRYLEPQRYGMYYDPKNLTILWATNYDETMSMVTLWGAKQTDAASFQTLASRQAPARERDSCVEGFL